MLNKLKIYPFFIFGLFFSACDKDQIEVRSVKAITDSIVYPHIALGSNVGIVVGIIHKDKTEIYSYGEKELGQREPISKDITLEIASLTKTFTALALADMVIKGTVNLDDPVENFLPPNVIIPSKDGVKITLKHLANHTSGLPRLADNMDQDAFNPYKGYSEEKLIDFLKNYKLPTVPGTKVNYSNIGYGLLGHVLSLKNDSDYETMITENIFRPLGMTHSFVMLTEERMKNQSPGYHGNQRMLESWAQQQQNISQGSGAISSNMQDLLIYLKANMGITITSLISAINLTHQRTTENEGLGWNFQDIDGQEFIMKNGLNGSYASFAGFSKNTKTGVVILTNSSLLPDLIPTKIGLGLLKKLRKL